MFVTPSPPPTNPAPPFVIIGGIIAGLRRDKPIGGWLFFFLWGAFVGLGITIFTVFDERTYFLPAKWANQTKYLLYLLSYVPRLASLIFLVAACSAVIARRDARALSTLRQALAMYLTCQFVTVAIDASAFPRSLNTALAALIFPSLFLLYSFRSNRVDRVLSQS